MVPISTHLQVDQLVGGLAQQLLPDLIERRHPDMSRMVHNTQAQDVSAECQISSKRRHPYRVTRHSPMQRRRVRPITLFTPPSIALLQDLLVAPLGRTSRVTERLVLDKVDGRPCRKVFRLVRRADILVLDLTDRLDLVWSNRLTAAGSTHTRV